MSINDQERLNLKKLVHDMECDNNTDTIRKLKHSVLIRDDIRRLETLKHTEKVLLANDTARFSEMAKNKCVFLYTNYTDIFNKVLKDELDLGIMTRLLGILKMIEDEKVDQHEGSVLVGKILKELYIDSALKRADNLDKEHPSDQVEVESGSNISWHQYKNR
jgi:hypothetical protein